MRTSLALYSAHLGAAGLSDQTRILRRKQITRLINHLDTQTCTTTDLEAWLTQRKWKTETLRSHISAARSYFTWLNRTGRRRDNPADSLKTVRQAIHYARPAPESALRTAAGVRERMMIDFGAQLGLRRGEIATLHSSQLMQTAGGWCVNVTKAKGMRTRTVPCPDHLARALRSADGFLFPGNEDGHLSADRVGRLIRDALPKGVTAHMLRHRFACKVYEACGDIYLVQTLLGHANPSTTETYCRVPDRKLRSAAAEAWV